MQLLHLLHISVAFIALMELLLHAVCNHCCMLYATITAFIELLYDTQLYHCATDCVAFFSTVIAYMVRVCTNDKSVEL